MTPTSRFGCIQHQKPQAQCQHCEQNHKDSNSTEKLHLIQPQP
jgi:hypothetical protein